MQSVYRQACRPERQNDYEKLWRRLHPSLSLVSLYVGDVNEVSDVEIVDTWSSAAVR